MSGLLPGALVSGTILAAACATGASTTSQPPAPDEPRAVILAVNAKPDSALELAKFALGAIEGTVQLPKVRPQMYTVANHHLRNRDGGGQTQIAVIVAVDRRVRDATAPVSLVEVSVWVLDIAHQLTPAQRRAGVPSTPITTNAPAFRQPRAMTPRDTVYWKSVEAVVTTLEQFGARRLP